MGQNVDKKIKKLCMSSDDTNIKIASAKEQFETRINKNIEKKEQTAKLVTDNKELALLIAYKAEWAAEIAFANEEKVDRASELVIANKEIAYQIGEKADRESELIIANKEIAFQSGEKADRAAELVIANKELVFQSGEKANRAAELIIANKELAFQIREKADRAAELVIANRELAFQIGEKADRAAELIIANKELAFQNKEKAERAAELIIANKALAIQNGKNADKAVELIIANKELASQSEENSAQATELVIAYKALAFQIGEKVDKAAELTIANKKLVISNKALALQSKENAEWAEKLIIANKEQGEYFVNISHELKTPLNVINSAAQLLRMYCNRGTFDENKESIINYIDSTTQNCYRLSKLINNIVDSSKIDAGFLKLNLSNNNIVEVVEKIVTSVTAITDNEDLSIIFDTNVEEKIIACDSEMIERIVLNLISNAIKFSDVGDEIFVQVKDRNEFVEILVKDNGIGIEAKDLDMIFDRFKQVDKSLSRNTEGTGIGLSLVKSIAELHGGSIHVESEIGKGSKFTIKLPSKNVCHESRLYVSNMKTKNESIKVELSDVYL